MRKITALLVGIIILLAFPAGYKFAHESLNRYSGKFISRMKNKSIAPGIKIKAITFGSAEISSLDTLSWHSIQAGVKLDETSAFLPGQTMSLQVNRLQVIALNLFKHDCLLLIDGIDAVSADKSRPEDQLFFTKGKLHLKFKLNIFSPQTIQDQLSEIVAKATEIFRTGRSRIPMNCSGLLSFSIKKQGVNALLKTTMDEEGYYVLAINDEFFKTTAWLMDEDLTDVEARILSRNPFKLKKLLTIMQAAKKESEKYKAIKTVPEDAYRHILWSYLLTVEYGPGFAKAFTDAHEQGDVTNTPAEHEMDYKNNAIGRNYAAKGYKRHEILTRLLNDPDVIWHPGS